MYPLWLRTLQHHLAAGHITRREFVRRAALLGFSAPAISAALAACGGGGGQASPTAQGNAASTPAIRIEQNVTATPSPATPTPAASPAGKSGGSVNLARGTDSDNLDPVTQDGNVDIWVLMNVYDQLVTVADNGLELMPGLAEKWDVSQDGTTYTFHIRQGVKFYDGTPLKVSDIKWSIERAKTTKESIWTFTLDQVKEITTPDDRTVVITLSQPWAPFLSDISMFNASIISQAFAQKIGVDKLVEQTMGTGPFHVKEWKKGQAMTLVRNPNYWEPGLPRLDQITLTVIPDSNSRILQVKGGAVDGIIGQNDVPLSQVNDLKSDPNLQVLIFPSTYNNFVVLNTRQAPLNDINVRQALNYATDKQTLIKSVLFGIGEPSNSFMPNGALYWNKDQPGYPFDLNKAKQLMAQSSVPNGFKLEFQILAGNQQQLQIATALKDMWSKIGVDLDIVQLEQGVFTNNYRQNKFQARLAGWTNDIIDPDELVSYAILPDQTENYHTGWVNQEAIDLAKQARQTLDPEKRRQLYYRIQEIHMHDAPFVYLFVIPYVDVLRKRVQGFFHHPMGQWVFKRMYVTG